MPKSVVAIARGEDPRTMIFDALEQIEAAHVVDPTDRVVLKPNYVEPRMPDTGITTDPRVIAAVAEWLQSIGVRDITIAESSWNHENTDRAFQLVGLPQIADKLGVRLLNLYDDERVEVDIPNAHSLHRVGLARTLLDATCLITIPKLKCHSMSYVTLGIKNLMGAVLPDKEIMHTSLSGRLCDLATVLPTKLTVIDGLVGSERHETSGDPVETGLIVAGRDPVATDAVGAMIMGIDPTRVEHLRLCAEAGLGEHRPNRIRLLGAPLSDVRKPYRQPHAFR